MNTILPSDSSQGLLPYQHGSRPTPRFAPLWAWCRRLLALAAQGRSGTGLARGVTASGAWVLPALLVVVPLAVFAQVLGFPFLPWDDHVHLWENPGIRDVSLSSMLAFWQAPWKGLYIPVIYTTWGLTSALCRVLGLGAFPPSVFHALPLLAHVGSGLLVWQILRLLLTRTAPDLTPRHAAWAACAGALLFAVHPLQVEPVAWVSGLKDTLAGCWALVALWGLLRALEGPSRGWGWLATGAVSVALLTKPSTVIVPLLAGLLAAWGWPATWRRQWGLLGGWCLLAVGVGLLTMQVQGERMPPKAPWEAYAFWPLTRLALAGEALMWYSTTLFCPLWLSLMPAHTPGLVLASWQGWLTGLVPWGGAAALWWVRPRWMRPPWSRLAVGAAVFVLGLLPVLGLTRFVFQDYASVANRYASLALLGPALALAWSLARCPSRWGQIGVAVLLAGLAGRSAWQAHQWRTYEAVLTQALWVDPANDLAHAEWGRHLATQGRLTEAVQYYHGVVYTWPSLARTQYHLALGLAQQGQEDEARTHAETAVRLEPRYNQARQLLANLLLRQGRVAEAIPHVQDAIRIWPSQTAPYRDLATLFRRQGRLAEAQAATGAAQRGGLTPAEARTAAFLRSPSPKE